MVCRAVLLFKSFGCGKQAVHVSAQGVMGAWAAWERQGHGGYEVVVEILMSLDVSSM